MYRGGRPRLDPAEVVALNDRLLHEISQVQLKMIDVLRDNSRLRSELEQLRRSLGEHQYCQEPYHPESAPPPSITDTDKLRQCISEMQNMVNRVESNHEQLYLPPQPLVKSPFLSRTVPSPFATVSPETKLERKPLDVTRIKQPYFSPARGTAIISPDPSLILSASIEKAQPDSAKYERYQASNHESEAHRLSEERLETHTQSDEVPETLSD